MALGGGGLKLINSGTSPFVYVLYTLTTELRKCIWSFALSVAQWYRRIVIVNAKSVG